MAVRGGVVCIVGVVVIRPDGRVQTVAREMRTRLDTFVVTLKEQMLAFAAQTIAAHEVLEAGAEFGIRPGVDERIDESARDGEEM